MRYQKNNLEVIVLLHNIRSIHNTASIFRTADGAGVKKIYLCGITPAPTDRFGTILPQFIKVSLGAEKYLMWEKRQAIGRIIDQLKKDGYKIFAVERTKRAVPYYRVKPSGKIALVVGNEINGLPPSILKKSDEIVEIPMFGKKESLNVSVAFGIAVYRLIFP